MNSFALQWPAGVDQTAPVLIPLYDVTAMSGVENYSDLDYTQIDCNLGSQLALSDNLHLAADLRYQKFTDDQPYVYGDLDGEAWRGYLALGYRF